MGCAACSELCASQPKTKNTILDRAKDKALYLKNTFKNNQLQQFISNQELDNVNKINFISQFFLASELNFLQAGDFYLKNQRRLIWKLFAIQPLAHTNYIATNYKYQQNPIPQQQKTKQRFYQISLDINRTYPTTKQLNKKSLQIVLQNLTLYFQNVGYTQGMNFIVGFFLLCGFTQKQSFWLFVHLSWNKNFLLIKNFMQRFTYVNFMVAVFQNQMKKSQILTQVCKVIEQCGLNSYFYSFSWFLCYFLYNLSQKSTVIIWNYFLTNKIQIQHDSSLIKLKQVSPIKSDRGGNLNVITFALVLLQYLGPQLIQNNTPQEILKVLRNQNLSQQITPTLTEDLILKCYQKNSSIKLQTLIQLAQKHDQQFKSILIPVSNEEDKQLEELMKSAILLKKKQQNFNKKTEIVQIVGKNVQNQL